MTDSVTSTPLWQQARHGEFRGVKGIAIRYCIVDAIDTTECPHRGALVISNGRIESYMKYWPLVQWLHQQGFSLYLWDHRGQGLSERLLENPHIGHVQHFNDYVADMTHFVRDYVRADNPKRCYLLAHSMGAAIAALYLNQYPHHFDRALFSAPMFGIQLPAPRKLLDPVIAIAHKLKPTGFVIGGHNYKAVPFEQNELSHDQQQYQQFRRLYQDKPELQLGSPSVHWLRMALDCCERIAKMQISTPLQLVLAGADTIVDNHAANAFALRGQHPLMTIDGAKHELLMEHPRYRQPLQDKLLSWFE